MKDYLWIIIVGCFAIIAFLVFVLTINTSSSLIKKLHKRKINIIINVLILLIGISNIGIGVYLLQDVREQIEKINSF